MCLVLRYLGISQNDSWFYLKRLTLRKCWSVTICMIQAHGYLVEKNLSLSLDMCPKTANEKEQMSKVLYSSVDSSLMYAMMCTRPDICYAFRLVSIF